MNFKFLGRNITISKPGDDPLRSVHLTSDDLLRFLGMRDGRIDTTTKAGQALAFARCSILVAIITKKVSAMADARYWMQDSEGADIEKPQEFARIMRPNQWQTLPELVCMAEFFSQIFGKAYIARIPVAGFKGEFELFVVPNIMVDEVERTSLTPSFAPYASIERYTIRFPMGAQIDVAPEDMFIVNDTTYALNCFGDSVSRMCSLADPINSFIASYEACNELLVNRGMLGIISLTSDIGPAALTDAMPATKGDKDALKDELKKYGILRGFMKWAITSYKATFTPVSSNIKDLGTLEIQNSCKREIAYTYQVPSILLEIQGSTYANLGEAKLDFYTNDIIPSALNIARMVNKIYDFEDFGIVPKFDHLDLFQNAKRQQAAGLTALVSALNQAMQSGLMPEEQAREELNKYLI